MIKRIDVHWDGERGAYFVSEPSWDGGTVVMASDYEALRFELSNALEYARQTMPPSEFADAIAILQDSPVDTGVEQ